MRTIVCQIHTIYSWRIIIPYTGPKKSSRKIGFLIITLKSTPSVHMLLCWIFFISGCICCIIWYPSMGYPKWFIPLLSDVCLMEEDPRYCLDDLGVDFMLGIGFMIWTHYRVFRWIYSVFVLSRRFLSLNCLLFLFPEKYYDIRLPRCEK